MTGEQLRRNVWEEMLYAQMRAQYFAELVQSYARRDKWLRVLVLVASSGAVATGFISTGLKIVPPIVAALGSFWLLLSGYPSLQREAAELYSGWNKLGTEYERLWNHLDASDVENRFHSLYTRGDELSALGAKFPNNRKRLDHWLTEVSQLATSRYA